MELQGCRRLHGTEIDKRNPEVCFELAGLNFLCHISPQHGPSTLSLPLPRPLLFPPSLSFCSVWVVVSTCALQRQRPHRGLISGHHEHGGHWWGEIHLPHQHLPFRQLWQRNVTHCVEWVFLSHGSAVVEKTTSSVQVCWSSNKTANMLWKNENWQ